MSFKKVSWIQHTTIYEVNLRQYTPEGTFKAFAKSLPRLKQMGIQTLWFMPVTPIAQKNKKGSLGSYYACSDYTAVNPEFGTLADFKDLVKEAHAMGFKVVMDWVANHTGWDHVWTKTHPDYFKRDTATHDFKIASGMEDIIELDYNNPAMRKAMIDAMKFWVTNCDIDGFRCDLAFWVQLDFWMQARTELEKTKTLFWLAEEDPLEHPEYYRAFDACYTWTWMHKTEDYYKKGLPLATLDSVLDKYHAVCGSTHIPLWFTANHDENTWNGTEYEKYGDMAKALAVFSFTWNGMPMIYSGQELPNTKRLEFFERDPIAWNGKYELADFYSKLIAVHTHNPALAAADGAVTTYRIPTNDPAHVMAYLRRKGNHQVLVILNLGKEKAQVTIHDGLVAGNYTNVFTKEKEDLAANVSLPMEGWGYMVLER